jgi:hypothetical protein
MISLGTIFFVLSIIFIHWIADFVLQTHEQAINKSKDNWFLTKHVWSYTIFWFVPLGIISILHNHFGMNLVPGFENHPEALWFFPITFVSHWITDYFTSRLNAKLWAKGDVHNFFVSVGFDQVLHYIQLFGTLYILL